MAFVPKLGLHARKGLMAKGSGTQKQLRSLFRAFPVQGRESGNGENKVEFKVAGPRP